ncbi:guanylate kinase [Metamycoplasma subdolum]|uniref:Guanylate kinase n=1 Tax=Metamycoplasma subdolum TaxID=92407 RepID=A0A3M0A997_9BACT|nr:guanylate kinase [Metamycoplasma subdolum]RMA78985.1 guanylate kinase [Metamycoplasma subdolum]WPB50508.1 guanylate kinase [Metamycoplasma subdolum]
MGKRKLIIFTGPSGVGKGTLEKYLFANSRLKLKLSVSATTRKPREGEVDGVHYYFISRDTFDACLADGKFIEYSLHFDNYYGTLHSEIEHISKQGKIPFLEIETNGAMQIVDFYKKHNKLDEIVSIFLMPPSLKELEKRIITRNTESPETISKRMEKAKEEIGYASMFDYVVTNNSIKVAADEVKAIIKKEFKDFFEQNKHKTQEIGRTS